MRRHREREREREREEEKYDRSDRYIFGTRNNLANRLVRRSTKS